MTVIERSTKQADICTDNGIIVVDDTGVVLDLNPEAEYFYGLQNNNAVGKPLSFDAKDGAIILLKDQQIRLQVLEMSTQKVIVLHPLQQETMQRTNMVERHLFTEIAQDFRAPLAVISTSASILRRYHKTLSEAQINAHATQIEEQSRKIADQVDEKCHYFTHHH